MGIFKGRLGEKKSYFQNVALSWQGSVQ